MPLFIRTAAIAVGMAFSLSVQAAKPAKPAKAPKPEAPAAAPVEVELAHQLGQGAADGFGNLVERFNQSQKDVVIKLVPLTEGGKLAPLNLARRQDIDGLLFQKGAVRPLHQLLAEGKVAFNAGSVSPDLKTGAFDDKGKLVALPIAYSTPVLFYNKALFQKAGLDPEKPPRTWWELQETAGKLFDAGSKCPYTTSWPTWVHVDNISALSGTPVAAPKGEWVFNGLPQVKHVAMMASWSKARYLRHFGRRDEADKSFASGECAAITTDSAAYGAFREAGVDLGVAPMPHHDDVYGGRQRTLADGAALWVGAGFKPRDYKAAARFVAYLLTPEVQMELARSHGYLPLTQGARNALKSRLLQDKQGSAFDVAYGSLKGEGAQLPLRVSAVEPVRIIADEELEAVWEDQKPAKAALDSAVTRGNAVLSAKPALKRPVPF